MTKPARPPIVAPAVFWVLTVLTLALIAGMPLFDHCGDMGGDAAGDAMSMGLGAALQIVGAAGVALFALLFVLIKQRVVRAAMTLLLCVPLFGLVYIATLVAGAC